MSNFKNFFNYPEVQGILKSQDEDKIQVFLYFENLNWSIPNIKDTPESFTYTIEKDERMDENEGAYHHANIIAMYYSMDTDVNDIIEHISGCLQHNYEIEERNQLFNKFIKVAQAKFTSSDINELNGLISKFTDEPEPEPENEVKPEVKKSAPKPKKERVTGIR